MALEERSFAKGISIEEGGMRRGEKIKKEKLKKPPKPLLKEKNLYFKELPELSFGDTSGVLGTEVIKRTSNWMPRFFPISGALAIPKFDRDKKTGKGMTIPQIVPYIEKAIRQQKEISKEARSFEKERLDNLIGRIYNFSLELKEEKVTEKTLEELDKDTQKLFTDLGITKPRNPYLVDIVEMRSKVPQKDRLNRFNPTIMRTRLRSMLLNGFRRELVLGLIAKKADRITTLLLTEREFSRAILANVYETLANIFSTEENALNKKAGEKATPEQIWELRKLFSDIVRNDLRQIRVAPYLGVARYAEYSLVPRGDYYADVENTLYYYGFGDVIGQKSIIELIIEGNPEGIVQTKLNEMGEKIKGLLLDPEYQRINPSK